MYSILKSFPRASEKAQFYFILFLCQIIYIFEMIFVYPIIIAMFNMTLMKQVFLICLASFCLINVCGNLIMSIATEINIRGNRNSYCTYCEKTRPQNVWHCRRCNTCIQKRDHHCTFLACCVGLHNRRFYILFMAHVTMTMVYATYYNWFWLATKFESTTCLLISLGRLLLPILWFLTPKSIGRCDFYLMFMCMNIVIVILTAGLFYYHFKNAVFGVTAYENKYKPELRNIGTWKKNLIGVFGVNWYWAILWPFSYSPLPRYMYFN